MSILDRSAQPPDAVLRYDDHPDAVVDVFLPDGVAESLVVFLHGGFWRPAYDRSHVRPLAVALANDGAVVALPEYRRVGAGGGWPTTCDDVRRALDALPGMLNGIGVRPSRTVLTGHSAGGHLTLWLAATGLPGLDAVVPLAPVGDLRAAAAIGMGDGAVQAFLGGDPTEVTASYDAADPAVLLDAHHPDCPVRILHGTADDVVTIENSRGLVRRHPWIDLIELDGVDHFDLIDPEAPVYAELVTTFRS
ncbi:MAG: alpha/beta hydrolase [Actinomycetota bacterium]|nr:alpha/beta hydrolase [Actinomycetota bacterium]